MTANEVLVDNETLVVSGDQFDLSGASALLQWSLHRSLGSRPVTIEASSGGTETSIIAFDLRVELLGDPTSYELTRGMQVRLSGYEPLAGATHRLRAALTAQLRDRILDFGFRPPPSDDAR